MTKAEESIETRNNATPNPVPSLKTPPMPVRYAEPEDAYLTGGQRNLQRRVLGLNVEAGHAERLPRPSPGDAASGSFTDGIHGVRAKA